MSNKPSTHKSKIERIKEITITLEVPFERGSEVISELTLRRPKAKDIAHMGGEPSFQDMLTIAQRCAQVPKSVIDELDTVDALQLIEAVADFLDSGQGTGKKRKY